MSPEGAIAFFHPYFFAEVFVPHPMIFHISTIIHKEKEAKRKPTTTGIYYFNESSNLDHTRGDRERLKSKGFCRPFGAMSDLPANRGLTPPATICRRSAAFSAKNLCGGTAASKF
jgi:hypothetical protein